MSEQNKIRRECYRHLKELLSDYFDRLEESIHCDYIAAEEEEEDEEDEEDKEWRV